MHIESNRKIKIKNKQININRKWIEMKKLDPFNLQVISFYLKTKDDFLNIIWVNKKYRLLLDRFRINPIKITKEPKNIFQFLDTQQLFGKKEYNHSEIDNIPDEEEIILENTKILQYNYEVSYSDYLKKKEKRWKEIKMN